MEMPMVMGKFLSYICDLIGLLIALQQFLALKLILLQTGTIFQQ